MQITLRKDGYAAGRPCYLVLRDGSVIGRVWRRDGGWWTWHANANVDGRGGTWEKTRKEAVRRVVRFDQMATA